MGTHHRHAASTRFATTQEVADTCSGCVTAGAATWMQTTATVARARRTSACSTLPSPPTASRSISALDLVAPVVIVIVSLSAGAPVDGEAAQGNTERDREGKSDDYF